MGRTGRTSRQKKLLHEEWTLEAPEAESKIEQGQRKIRGEW
jgi:hypothetical protein